MKQCPNNADCTEANFDKCIRDYLEAVAGFPNIGNQLICWLCTAKKPTLMPMHKFTWRWVRFSATLRVATSVKWWKYPQCKRRSKSSSPSLRHTKTSLQTWTRRFLPTRSRWSLSLSSIKQPTRWLAFLRRLPRTRSSHWKGKWLIFLLHVAMNRATISIVVVNIMTIIEATNATATIFNHLSSTRQSMQWLPLTQQQGLEEHKILWQEGWSQTQSLQEKEQQGHA